MASHPTPPHCTPVPQYRSFGPKGASHTCTSTGHNSCKPVCATTWVFIETEILLHTWSKLSMRP
eukprot:COSAG02_NODE_17_length_55377_cov_106.402258_25_plen_64_part_00